MAITLEMLLASRDARRDHEKDLMLRHPGQTLVVMTVVMPGSVKRNSESLCTAHAGVEALRKAFGSHVTMEEEKDLPTGYEAYLLVDLIPAEAKLLCCEIEDKHPLGRLMDLDVIQQDGEPLSRQKIGMEGRKCIVCGEHDARYCMRAGTHTPADLAKAISAMINAYGFR